MWWYDGADWWVGMTLMMLVVWGLVIAGGIALWRATEHRNRDRGAGSRSALDVLDERFARGEIDADEYTHRRELLRSGH